MALISKEDLLTKFETGALLFQPEVKRIIKIQPEVDAVEVVRCKDCKWYGRADKSRFYRGMDCLNKRIATIVPDVDYCSRAERRTDETD